MDEKQKQRLVDLHAVLRQYGWRATGQSADDGVFWWKKQEVPGLTVITGPKMYTAFLGPWPHVFRAGSKDVTRLRARLHSVAILLGEKPNLADLYARWRQEAQS